MLGRLQSNDLALLPWGAERINIERVPQRDHPVEVLGRFLALDEQPIIFVHPTLEVLSLQSFHFFRLPVYLEEKDVAQVLMLRAFVPAEILVINVETDATEGAST